MGQLCAQKHDYVWLSGYRALNGFAGFDSGTGLTYGHSIQDFHPMPMALTFDSLLLNFDHTNSSFCDSTGVLMLYTNGVTIHNSLDVAIENGDSLNAGYFYSLYPQMWTSGYRAAHGAMALPGLTASQCNLFHVFIDTLHNSGVGQFTIVPKKLLLTAIDMSANVGNGKATAKNQELVADLIGGEVTAVKHGNGRDWWILMQKRKSNCFYRILVRNSGIEVLADLACEGSVVDSLDYFSDACFTPDGAKFVYLSGYNGLNIYDFDRCDGTLTNSVHIPIPITQDGNGIGLSISPNSRFLYVGFTGIMYQYDLTAINISSSVDTIGIFDGTSAPFPAQFHMHQLAPDGKIYISCGNTDSVFHVINYPDLEGGACDFQQHSVYLPSLSAGVPNFPNYRLGPLVGSACDSLTGMQDVQSNQNLKIYPNPASEFVVVDYGFSEWNYGDIEMTIVNPLGQIQFKQLLPRYSGFQRLMVKGFGAGMYTVVLKQNGVVISSASFSKQ